jgi:uncharacterized protein YbaP (TraB family)
MKSIKVGLLLLLGFVPIMMFAQVAEKSESTVVDSAVGVAVLDDEAKEGTSTKQNSLLWEISGNGLEEPSYLFGTIHIIGKEDYFWTDLMEEKFQQTEKLVLEIDMGKNQMMMMLSLISKMRMKDGKTLHDLLTKKEYKEVEDYFMDNMGMSLATFDRFKPIFTSMIIAQGEAGEAGSMEDSKSYEMELVEKAKQRKMKIDGLETVAYQISMFDSIPYETQAEMLIEAINAEVDSGETTFDDMVELYKNQDLEGLYAMITEEDSEIEGYEDLLLVTRNKNWIPLIAEMTAKNPTFIAVGAGHLPGKSGVINLLIAAGYTLTPLR